MPTLSASFEQLKEIATLQEVSDLSERYTVDSAFESLYERLSILDDNFDNLHSLQALVERGETGPALEAFCGKDFKEVFHMEDISMESLTLAGVALVIWCILAIVAIIEFFMMVWSMIFGGKGGGGGVTVTLKRSAKSLLAELIDRSVDEIEDAIRKGGNVTDAQIDNALSFNAGMSVGGVVIPQDVINDVNDRLLQARERCKRIANEKQDQVSSDIAKQIGKEIGSAVHEAYKTLAQLPVRVRGDGVESAVRDHTGDLDLVRESIDDISCISPRSIRLWIKKITDFVGPGISQNIIKVTHDLAGLKNAVATCIGDLEQAEQYINNGTYSVPPINNINTFWEEKEQREEYFKSMTGNMAHLLRESVDLAISSTQNDMDYTHTKLSILELYEKNRSFYVSLFEDLKKGTRIQSLFGDVTEAISEKIKAALQPASELRNADNKAEEMIKRLSGVFDSLEDVWKSTLGDSSWSFDTEMTELRVANEKTKGTLDNIHSEFKTLAEKLQASSEKMRKNYPKNPGGFRKICEFIMAALGNTATDSREHIKTILGFLAGYLRVADNVTKSYTKAMDDALSALITQSRSIKDQYVRFLVTVAAAAAPVPRQS